MAIDQRILRDALSANMFQRNRRLLPGSGYRDVTAQRPAARMSNQVGTGMGLGYGGMPGTMMSSSGGGKMPWQKGKALEDYMMKKLRDRDNEEFYKNSPVFGGKPKGITSPEKPSPWPDEDGSNGIYRNPRSLQDYGDWDWDEFEQ